MGTALNSYLYLFFLLTYYFILIHMGEYLHNKFTMPISKQFLIIIQLFIKISLIWETNDPLTFRYIVNFDVS